MTEHPELDEFRREIDALKKHPLLRPLIKKGEIELGRLSADDVSALVEHPPAYYFLLAAADLNRTSLKKLTGAEDARIIKGPAAKKAHVISKRLPKRASFEQIASASIALRQGTLTRHRSGSVESLFRKRLADEGIPVAMSPPIRPVPGILIGNRKPDGVYPDPKQNLAPLLYLEIKNVRRVADDIQKRLYEIAEVSLEMKLLYGNLRLEGHSLGSTADVVNGLSEIREALKARIRASRPAVVALLVCPRASAEKYRAGAEAFVDRVFFEDEIDECLAYLKDVIRRG